MPFLLFVAYLVLETLTFWAVVSLIGVGWALVALFATMFFGMSIAGWEARRIMSSKVVRQEDGTAVMQDDTPGKTAGNVGLTMVGGILLTLPGFFTTLVGLLFLFPPTRALLRGFIAFRLLRSVENFGVRLYDRSPMSQQHDSYGSFGGPAGGAGASHEPTVLEEEEIRRWSENANPSDFGEPDSGNTGDEDGSQPGDKR